MKFKWILKGFLVIVVATAVTLYAILSSYDFEDLREVIQAEAKKATGRELVLAGPADLQISLSPAITVADVTFANAPWGSRKEMLSVKRFELVVSLLGLLTGDINVKRLVLVEPDILLETNAKGQGNWEIAVASEKPSDGSGESADGGADSGAATLPSFDRVVIQDGKLTYRDGKTGQETRLLLTKLEGSATSASSPLELSLEGAYNDAPFAAKGILGSLAELSGGQAVPVNLTAEAGGATLVLEGRLAAPGSGQKTALKVRTSGESLAGLGVLTGGSLPPLGPYALDATINQKGQIYKLVKLTAKMGTSTVTGDATVSLAGKRPLLKATLSSEVLDMADFSAPAGDGGESAASETVPAAGGGQRYVFTKDPLPLDGLGAADANIKLTTAQLKVKKGLALSGVDLGLVLKAGNLTVTPLAVLAGGKLSGKVALSAKNKPTLAATFNAKGVDYGKLLKDMAVSDDLAGTLDVAVNLRGSGKSLRAIAAGLNGKTEVVSGEGQLSNRFLKIVSTGLAQILEPLTTGSKDVKLNCIVSRFDIKNGVATSKALVFDTATFTVGGGGTIDLRSEKLDLSLDTATREAALVSLAIPFLIKGTLASPEVTPDPLGTAKSVAKTVDSIANLGGSIGSLLGNSSQSASGGGGTAGANPCVAALDQSGPTPAKGNAQPSQPKSTIEDATDGAKKALEDAGKGISKGLKGLFGN